MSNSKKKKKVQKESNDDAKEFLLSKQMMNEHKARKRIRGPYRKSDHPQFSKEKIDFIHNHESSTAVLHQAPINSYFYLP